MKTQMEKLDVVSNNLANVDTAGFKKDEAVVSSFPEMLMTKIYDTRNNVKIPTPIGTVSLGVKIDEIYTNFAQGAFKRTDDVFHLAIQGDGFFTIDTPNGELFSRDGSFVINSEGQLTTQEGNHVMGESGIITLGDNFLTKQGEASIDNRGRIIIDGEYVDTIRLVNFEDLSQLKKMGDNLYEANGETIPFEGQVMQGFVEVSNMNPVNAMVDLIAVSRTYEANQKMIQVHDSLMGKAVNDVGKA